ncbi:head-tail connector protein [Clostridium perfringens]|uniref:head-tail connector protein n=1 Tax=Clostridium perfringens TaxID=1502 RepID=UPI0018E4D618|nr:head-tail connector protein [Clostridium perfringens]MBI6052347.1 phage head-tail connector protein [Clostridium perfringens]
MVSLEEVKNHLRVSEDNERINKEIQDYIQQAEIYIDSCCGVGYKKYDDKVKLSDLLVKKIANDLYENAGMMLEGKKGGYDRISETILDILANCGD